MQCETTQCAEFGPKTQKEPLCSKYIQTKGMTLKDGLPTSRPCTGLNTCGSTANVSHHQKPNPRGGCRDAPATAGVHDLNTTYQVTFQPLPIERKPTSKKRAEDKRPPMDLLSTYRKDFPEYKHLWHRPIVGAWTAGNLQINRNLPTDFNTTQKESYIGWDPTVYPRPDLIKYRDNLSETEGTIDSDTMSKLAYQTPLTKHTQLARPRTMQSSRGGKFDDETAYRNSFKDWGPKARVRHGDAYEGTYDPAPGKIDNLSITRQDFTPKCDYKPMKPVFQQKITPNNSLTPLPKCRLQAYLIHQRLKELKLCSRPSPVATQ
uniref:uncharacterized protein isoform X2 n=1 Tax=Pristiophorus japonicus TaxID=55135 RepID=UPI00398E8801